MRVGEVAARTGVSVRAIRYYEQAGLLAATRRANGYREFDAEVVERVRAIRDLLETGFTIEEVLSLAACLGGAGTGTACSAQTARLYREKLVRIDAQMRTLLGLRERIEERLATLDPAPVPLATRRAAARR